MVTVRRARPEEALAVAHVHVRAWQAGYRGLLPDEYLETLDPADRAARYDFGATDPAAPVTVVAVDQEVVVGFVTTVVRQREGRTEGQVTALYVDPPRWGHGVGRLLLREARTRLRAAGCTEGVLWVLVGNERANRFYEADGWTADGQRRREQVWGVSVDIICYRRALP